MKPDLFVVTNDTWNGFVKHKTNAAYERYGVLPGMFYDDGTETVYASEHFARQMFMQAKTDTGKPYFEVGEGLGEHELGHAWDLPLNDHPTGIVAGIKHAFQVGFDTRAFTRLLRWRWCKVAAHHERSRQWIQGQALMWEAQVLSAKPAPKA